MKLHLTILLLVAGFIKPAIGQLKQTNVTHSATPIKQVQKGQNIAQPKSESTQAPTLPKTPNGTIILNWNKPITEEETEGSKEFLSFTGASYDTYTGYLPKYSQRIALSPGMNQVSVSIANPVYAPLTAAELPIAKLQAKYISADINPNNSLVVVEKKSSAYLHFVPIRKDANGQYEKLVSFSLNIVQSRTPLPAARNRHTPHNSFVASSVLSSGTWYRIGVAADGIYKMDYNFFKSMGYTMSSLNPQNIRIYGNGGGMLPDSNSVYRADDLVENPIFTSIAVPGTFGTNDYVLFYGMGPHTWSYDPIGKRYHHKKNLYSDTTYYFVNADMGPGKRIAPEALAASATDTVTTFDDYAFHETDQSNLIQSGNEWFGEYFDATTSYTIPFNFPNIVTSVPGYVQGAVASRGADSGIYSFGPTFIRDAPVCPSCPFAIYATMSTRSYTFNPTGNAVNVIVTKQSPGAVGWLYYVEANVRRNLIMPGGTMQFRDAKSVGAGKNSLFKINSAIAVQVWDVSNPTNVQSDALTPFAGGYQFIVPTDTLKQFIAFDGTSYGTPKFFGSVPNQNLHAMQQADMVIVSYPGFYSLAKQLAAFHSSHDGLSVNVVTPQQVYNEFSSGRQDPVAIRDFMRMFYTRASNYKTSPKYLLLYGDASYDPKNRLQNNTDFIVTYESNESFDPTASFVSDDYFAVLDSNEGPVTGNNPYNLDIGVGRITASTIGDAQTVLNKIMSYETPSGEPSILSTNCCTPQGQYNMGNWRNTVCFIAHDGDGGEHETDADTLAKRASRWYPNLNINKIYSDAYPVVQTPGGERYPEVNTAIDNQMDQGALIMNFTGHGGTLGLAFQRILTFNDINSWTNADKLSLFFTASCEFARFDNPQQVSAGELCLTVSNGGNIGLMTTTRDVYALPNQDMNQAFYTYLYTKLPDGSLPRTGDLFKQAKDAAIADGDYVNSLNFAYLGDPAVRLYYPPERVYTSSINSVPVSATPDTLRALSKVTITGYVGDTSGGLQSGFNGVLYPTIYDKADSIVTLDNPNSSNPANIYFPFTQRNSILYKGRISVTNGKFTFSFVVPKDINYKYGFGKVSYYAQNGSIDATGNYQKVVIGGSSPTAYNTGKGPQLRVYMNDSNFVFDGLTNENPQLYALIYDTNGINTTANSIGHGITAVLDNNTQNTIDLTDYFQPALNSYQKGTINYPFSKLPSGTHSVSLRVWNVYNNTSQGYTEFNVEPQANLQLSHVLNYPNPFTTHTQFYFELNEVCDVIDVQIQVFTISGKLVRNILTQVKTDSFRSQPIDWDGRDDYGDKIANGVYIYHLKIRTSTGTTADTYQKLVIL